jgi:hypothetical protein
VLRGSRGRQGLDFVFCKREFGLLVVVVDAKGEL